MSDLPRDVSLFDAGEYVAPGAVENGASGFDSLPEAVASREDDSTLVLGFDTEEERDLLLRELSVEVTSRTGRVWEGTYGAARDDSLRLDL